MKRGWVTGSVLVLAAVLLSVLTLGACQECSPTAEAGSLRTVRPILPIRTADPAEPTAGELAEQDRSLPTSRASEGVLPRPEDSKVINLAIADLAQQLELPDEEIAVGSIKAVRCPDASLGCSQPGMVDAQAVTPGYRVVLVAEDATYVYHTDEAKIVALCEAEPRLGAPDQGEGSAVQDGWPNQPLGGDVIITPPTGRKP